MSSDSTGARILEAALALIARKGDANVTMAEIARAAAVSRQAVYLHFADRAALMVAAARHVDETRGLPDRIRLVAASPSGAAMIEAQVALQATMNPTVWPIARAVDAVRRTDAAAERAWQDRLEHRLQGCRAIVARLQEDDNLKPGLDAAVAADLLWTMTSLRTWEDLVVQRGWPRQRYQKHVTRVLLDALTRQGNRRGDR